MAKEVRKGKECIAAVGKPALKKETIPVNQFK